MTPDRDFLIELYEAAVRAVEPGRALSAALDAESRSARPGAIWILALGKAAHPLAAGAVAWLERHGLDPAGGVIVSHEAAPPPHASLTVVTGDHPLPGPASRHAAEVVEETVRVIPPSDEVWVLMSGGTTSLLASPVRGVSDEDLHETYATLLRSGLDIRDMNRVRKRISRWGGGRLAVALAHATVRVYILSDVVGDDVTVVGSGPCSPDRTTAAKLRARLAAAGMLQRLPPVIRDIIERTERGVFPETPKPGEPAFRNVTEHVIGSNMMALAAAAAHAEAAGLAVRRKHTPLTGDAARLGRLIGRLLVDEAAAAAAPACYIGGGETTVTLENQTTGRGGRCQELALAAARELDGLAGATVTLLAAGTDGRDGPTDAAGAIVDGATWRAIEGAGRDPLHDLEAHDSTGALDAAGALLRTGSTGTNVNDVLFAIVRPGS